MKQINILTLEFFVQQFITYLISNMLDQREIPEEIM